MDPAPSTVTTDAAVGSLRSRIGRWFRTLTGRRGWRDRPLSELLGIDKSVLVQALKIALSAGLSWALAIWLLDSPSPIWAPITAALIALLTVRASIRDAIEKVVAVLIGIVVAIWLGGYIGLHAWSIALIVAVGFLVGKMLRLNGGAAAQIPINGLFVLALGTTSTSQVTQRFLDTMIGAAVAVVVNFAIIPPNYVSEATRSVAALADGLVDVLAEIAAGITRPWTYDTASGWLRRARQQGRFATAAEKDVQTAGQSLHLHPGRSSWSNALDRLQQANDTLQIVEVQVRTLARTVRDIATKMPEPGRFAAADADGVGDVDRRGRGDRGVRLHDAARREGREGGGRRRRRTPGDRCGASQDHRRSTRTSGTCWRPAWPAGCSSGRWWWRQAGSWTSWKRASTR